MDDLSLEGTSGPNVVRRAATSAPRRARRSPMTIPTPAPPRVRRATRTRPPSSTVTFGEMTTPTNARGPIVAAPAAMTDHVRRSRRDVPVRHQRATSAVADRDAAVREHGAGPAGRDREVAPGGDQAGAGTREMHVARLHDADNHWFTFASDGNSTAAANPPPSSSMSTSEICAVTTPTSRRRPARDHGMVTATTPTDAAPPGAPSPSRRRREELGVDGSELLPLRRNVVLVEHRGDGDTGSHAAQSTHSSGWMYSIRRPS